MPVIGSIGRKHGMSRGVLFAATALGLTLSAGSAMAVDWAAAKGKDVILFYPGQASWEWVLTKSDHSGAPKFREGKNCRGCHEGEEADIGKLIVSGKKLEPTPVAGKRGSIPVNVKTAHDGQKLYIRLQWQAQDLKGAKMDAKYASKVTVMLDDGTIKEATRAGCWGACHDDATGMASSQQGQELHKYLIRSRTKMSRLGGGRNFKPDAELAKMAAAGEFLEYWQARLNPGAPASTVNGYILKDRTDTSPTVVDASAEFKNGSWTVVLSRSLKASGAFHKTLEAGKTYTIGIAIHDAYAAGRFHHVSFGHTLALNDGKTDFVAQKQ